MIPKQPLSPHDRALIMQTVTWLRTLHEARPAGSPPSYPALDDIDHSALFRRIRQGLTPMPWAPPTRQGLPAYDLIENARRPHRVNLDESNTTAESRRIDGGIWRVLANEPGTRRDLLAYGRWPLAFALTAQDTRRWSELPPDLEEGAPHDVVRFADGRIVAKELLRRTRDEIETQWWLECVSPLNERLYLFGQRQPLDSADPVQVEQVHRPGGEGADVFSGRLANRDETLLFFRACRDPWTRVSRYLAVPADSPLRDTWLSSYRPDGDACELIAGERLVIELDDAGAPLSAWRSEHAEIIRAVTMPDALKRG